MIRASSSPLRVSVLGAGSWGTALAALASRQSSTLLWGRNRAVIEHIRTRHENPRYLEGITLPPTLQATSSIQAAFDHLQPGQAHSSGLIILGVPVAGLAAACHILREHLQPDAAPAISVVWTCKGLQPDTGELAHQVVARELAPLIHNGLGTGVLSGPSFAHEVARGLPVALTIATAEPETASRTTKALHGEMARIYSSTDIAGVEIGGAFKNVIAIACGISDGLGLGDNARAALITRGLAEIRRIGQALGGEAETFFGLTGLGDLVLTTTGSLSRNRQVGLAIGAGKPLSEVLAPGMTAEGVRCAKAALQLAGQHRIDLPITRAVHDVLFSGLPPQTAVSQLLARQARSEATP
ncbi:MAG TPA: NAD(P)H-dependent glycerol-3-phosphate dehydrogenase [Burkholderiaceae bacterium]|nr:NAD(P)H-dependent glycerol-3-phosphate dehydrogenase [Burkholderiaceae bacterium]